MTRHTGRLRRWTARCALGLLVVELAVRVGEWLGHGHSSYYLWYGFTDPTKVGVSPWWQEDGSWYKFPPNYVLRGAAGQGEETATMNSLGFRGSEFAPRKPKDVFRIVALGENATFGFHVPDSSTYPARLQQFYGRLPGDVQVEVINAGLPYYNTASTRALLESELGGYEPDVLTLAGPYNDAGRSQSLTPAFRTLVWWQQHSILNLLLKQTVLPDKQAYRLWNRLRRARLERIDRATLEDRAIRAAAPYRANVEAIAHFAQARGIPLVLIRQPMTAHNRDPGQFASYADEVREVQRKLAHGALLSLRERLLLIHRRLIAELDAVARERKLAVVDNIAIVDEDRPGRFAAWAYLSQEGHLRLAEALKGAIEPLIPDGARDERAGSRSTISP